MIYLYIYIGAAVLAWLSLVIGERLDTSSKLNRNVKYSNKDFTQMLFIILCPVGNIICFFILIWVLSVSHIDFSNFVRILLLDFKPKKDVK